MNFREKRALDSSVPNRFGAYLALKKGESLLFSGVYEYFF